MHMSSPSDLAERLAFMRLPLSEQLIRKAEAAEAQAKSLEHCMWMGDQHPREAHLDDARMLRQAAAVALREEQAARRKAPAVG